MWTRRDWLRTAAQAAAATTLAGRTNVSGSAQSAPATATPADRPVFCFFSKHLPDLGWGDLGRAVKDAGFDGVDLTVRPGGHVLPERAADDLPRVHADLTAIGARIGMITTGITGTDSPHAEAI